MKKLLYLTAFVLLGLNACTVIEGDDPLPSWNDTPMKAKLVDFVENVVPEIPVEDRLAVFDMDGTIACEQPLWLEMYCAVQGLCMQVAEDSTLLEQPIYRYAEKLEQNPKDTAVINHWGPFISEMVHKGFEGWDNEEYIAYCKKHINEARQPDYKMELDRTFYPPMLEVLEFLKEYDFEIYIVSGSLQGLLWSICPEVIGFDRSHLIGTRQKMNPIYNPGKSTKFILESSVLKPENNNNGKALNIYSQTGKIPVIAFGNTTGDFGMFHLTSTNKLPNLSFLINHDDSIREYAYKPWHGAGMPAWKDTMDVNGWNVVDMSTNFKTVFPK